MTKRAGWLALAACVLVAPAARAQVRAGGEFRVNTHTPGNQDGPSAAFLRDGAFVVVWSSGQDGSSSSVMGQRFAASGALLGAEFRVNTYTTGAQFVQLTKHSVASTPDGRFVVSWISYLQDGSGDGVYGQLFDASGAPVGGEFQANTYTTGGQSSPTVAMAPDGGFVVVWFNYTGQAPGFFDLRGQRFGRAGERLGGELVISASDLSGIGTAASFDGSGGFIVVWSSFNGAVAEARGQRFAADGTRRGAEFRVNSSTTGSAEPFGVHAFSDGSFVVSWAGYLADGSDLAAVVRRFDPNGAPVGAETVVNTFTTGGQFNAVVAGREDGGFTVVFGDGVRSPGDGGPGNDGSLGVFGQRFDAAGQRVGTNFQVNTYTTNDQQNSQIASDAVGNFVIVWNSGLGAFGDPTQDGSGAGVYAQRYGGLVASAAAANTAGTRVIEPGQAGVDFRPAWRNVNGASQAFDGTLTRLTGPSGGTYTIDDATATYGTVANGATQGCTSCYAVTIAGARPGLHWDATADEQIAPLAQGQSKRWTLHVGSSFTDVPAGGAYYRFVETLLHRGVTGGCGAAAYCPADSVTREQMAPFVLAAKEGAGYVPAACSAPPFSDVPVSSGFCRFIQELARRGVVGGCASGLYCPTSPVQRDQMAVFVLRTLDPALSPPACVAGGEMFSDVPAASAFCRWVEELARRGVVSGCGGGHYCPSDSVTREQMAVFLSATFGLTLYGP